MPSLVLTGLRVNEIGGTFYLALIGLTFFRYN